MKSKSKKEVSKSVAKILNKQSNGIVKFYSDDFILDWLYNQLGYNIDFSERYNKKDWEALANMHDSKCLLEVTLELDEAYNTYVPFCKCGWIIDCLTTIDNKEEGIKFFEYYGIKCK